MNSAHKKAMKIEHMITIEAIDDQVICINAFNDVIEKLTSNEYELLIFANDDEIKKCIDFLIFNRQSHIDDFNDALRDFSKQS